MEKKLTVKELIEILNKQGREQACAFLLLAGPDGFDGTYEEYKAYENALCTQI